MPDCESPLRPGACCLPSHEREQSRLAALRRYALLNTGPDPTFDRFVGLAAKLLNAPIALISLLDADRQWCKAALGLSVRETPRKYAFCNHVIERKSVFVVPDAAKDERFADNPYVVAGPHVRFYAGAPLLSRDGHAIGTLCVIDDKPRRTFTAEEEATLSELAKLVMAHVEAREELGYIDGVTGLPNRLKLIQDIDLLISGDQNDRRKSFSVVAIDISGQRRYHSIVRTLGPGCADEFVVAAARVISEVLPAEVSLYQINLLRFGLVFMDDRNARGELLKQISERLEEPVRFGEILVPLRGTIGIATYPEHASTALDLVRCSLAAAAEAEDKRLPWSRYDPLLDEKNRRALRLLSELPAALEGAQLGLVYQPKVRFPTRQCTEAEALLRWTHPELGPIPPGEFIPLVERMGNVRLVTDRVLDSAIRQARTWLDDGAPVQLAVNVSMIDLQEGDLDLRLTKLLYRHRLPPELVAIEVTESALMRDAETAHAQLAGIRGLGVDVAIDDFGTGQSAHSYLKRVPANVLKIDQVFVRDIATDPRDQVIVRSMIELGHELGYKVVAEGIETREAYDWLANAGCELGQGYFISRPLSAAAFGEWSGAR